MKTGDGWELEITLVVTFGEDPTWDYETEVKDVNVIAEGEDYGIDPASIADTMLSFMEWILSYVADPSTLGPDGSYTNTIGSDEGDILIQATYDTQTLLLKHAVIKSADSGSNEGSYIEYQLIDTNIRPSWISTGTSNTEDIWQQETGDNTWVNSQTNTQYSSDQQTCIKDGDWAKYRITIDARDPETGEYAKASGVVTIKFEVYGGSPDYSVDDIKVESLDTNTDVTESDVEDTLSGLMYELSPYMEPSELPENGVIEEPWYSGQARVEYDVQAGLLKTAEISMTGGIEGTIFISLIDTSVEGVSPAGGIGLGFGLNPMLLAGVAGIVIVVVVVVVILMKKKRSKQAQVGYVAPGYVPPRAPPPPPP